MDDDSLVVCALAGTDGVADALDASVVSDSLAAAEAVDSLSVALGASSDASFASATAELADCVCAAVG